MFVKFPGIKTVAEGFPILRQFCDAVSNAFAPSPILLQAEKAMQPLLMLAKKRYVYMVYMGPTSKPELAYKGVELARRDNCQLVTDVMGAAVSELMLTRDMSKTRHIIDATLRELIGGRVGIGKLVVTKSVSMENYKSEPMQVTVAKRMTARDPNYVWGVAERIPYVIVNRSGKTIADRAEDPLWAINHDMTIDIDYYIKNQLSAPLARIFMWAMLSTEDKRAVAALERAVRETTGDTKESEKRLEKMLETLHKKVMNTMFGSQALAVHPRQEKAGTLGISSFFKKVPKCIACNQNSVSSKCGDMCARCANPTCHDCNKICSPGTTLCSECLAKYSACPTCGRSVMKPVADQPCLSCDAGLCYACGEPIKSTNAGICAACAKYKATRNAGMAAMIAGDVEDLVVQAITLKEKCDKCRGYPSDEINCVARDCQTLFERATVAARIKSRDMTSIMT